MSSEEIDENLFNSYYDDRGIKKETYEILHIVLKYMDIKSIYNFCMENFEKNGK